MSKDPHYRKAKERVTKKKEFYSHLVTYLSMSVFFIVLNLMTSRGHFWFQWPMIGWGLGVLFHYFDVFGVPGVGGLDEEWEERELRKEMRRLEQGGSSNTEEEELELRSVRKEEVKKNWSEDDLV